MQIVESVSTEDRGFITLAKHDLSANLRVIDGLVSFIHDDLEGSLAPQVVEHLDTISDRVDQMERLLGGIVEYERASLPADKPLRSVRMDELVGDVCSAVDRSEDVSIILEVDPIFCNVDTDALRACLGHLIANAVSHRSEPVGFVKVTVFQSQDFVEFHIEDDGVGLPANHIAVACEPLRKLAYDGRTDNGHGLGLAIVSRFATVHGAKLRIGSRESVGTSVRLSWPRPHPSTASFIERGTIHV